jgi:hypothetical protein
MANPRESAPTGVGSCAAVRGTKMSENRTPEVVVPVVAPIVAPSKINEAAISYSAYLRERGIDVSAEVAQIFWNEENVWRTSPAREAERSARKVAAEVEKAEKAKKARIAAEARLQADRARLAAKAEALGLTLT